MSIVKAEIGNLLESIEENDLDGIMNAANGVGPMGAGIAGAIRRAGGREIQDDAIQICKDVDLKEGDAYPTIAGKLEEQGIKYIIHAITMKNPGGDTSYDIVKNAFINALKLAKNLGVKRIGCTSLGTGIGGLDSVKVANIMKKIAESSKVKVVFIDFNKTFINELNNARSLK